MEHNYNPFELKNRKYLITGAASGIGRATSLVLSKLGANLILADINLEGLNETYCQCKPTDKILCIDLTKASLIKEEILKVVTDFGKINGFVHFAGIPYISPLKTISEEKCAEVYSLNTYAAIELAKVFTNRNVYIGEKG